MPMTLEDKLNYEALGREIAIRLMPDSLLSTEDVAAMLRYTPRYVRENLVLSPGFPEAIRLPIRRKDGKLVSGDPRWRRADILEWIEANRNGRRAGTRRRNQ